MVVSIPKKIVDIFEVVVGLPKKIVDLIVEGLKKLFIPTKSITDYFIDNTETVKNKTTANHLLEVVKVLFVPGSAPIPDFYIENLNILGYNIGRIKVFDSTYLVKGVEYLRPYLRGFLNLTLLVYFVKNCSEVIGVDLGLKNKEPVTGGLDLTKS